MADRWCAFKYINKDTCKKNVDMTVVKTVEGGEVVHCNNPACVALVANEIIENNTWISGQKTKEATRLTAKYGGLKTELAKSEYSGMTNEQKLAYLRDENNGDPIDNPVINAVDFKSSLDSVEYLALSPDNKTIIDMYSSGGGINLSNQIVIDNLGAILPGDTKSRAAIETLRIQKQSIGANLGFLDPKLQHVEGAGLI